MEDAAPTGINIAETVTMSEALSVVMRKREEAATGKPSPIVAYICRACAALYEDREATKLLHGKKGECCAGDIMSKIDANTIRFKDDEIVAAAHLE